MKRKIILEIFIIMLFTLSIYSQEYLYYPAQFVDSTHGIIDTLDKIQRYNIITGTVDNVPTTYQYRGRETYITSDPSQTFLLVSSIDYHKLIYFFYDTHDTSNYFVFPPDYGGIDELLYYPQGNKIFLFTNDYSSINVMDLSTRQIVDTLNFNNVVFSSELSYPYRNSFFSKDSSKIYFFSRDKVTQPYQVSTYSIADNEIIQKRNLSAMGYPNSDGYYLTFGRNGKGIICSFPNYNNPIKDFYFRVYDLDADTGSTFIHVNQPAEACFSGNGEYLIIMNMDISSSRVVYYTGSGGIYKTGTGKLIKSITVPPGGSIYNFDNYPSDIYYVLNLETHPEIYNLTKLNLNSLSVGISFPYSSGISITVKGKLFTSVSKVYFNNVQKETTYLSDSTLSFQLNPGDLSNFGDYPVWVDNYGSNSDTLILSVVNTLPQTITPLVDCVRNNGGNSYTAFFGYENNNSAPVFIPVGAENQFTKSPEDRGQPAIFLPGRNSNVFSIDFDGRNIVWYLNGIKVTASKNSPSCP